MSYSALPNYRQAMSSKGSMERTWYQFLSDVWKGKPAAGVSALTATSSPFRYQADSKGFMLVQGGTVILVQFSRDGNINYNTGQTQGVFPLAQGDTLIVTYSATPAVTWIPL
ncbi:MAG: hypothetical protein KGL39_13860 [Patescibacteria group bacterium]|nr:hypothetical protein [Patescibacteria group bacterium]